MKYSFRAVVFLFCFTPLVSLGGWDAPDIRNNGWMHPVNDFLAYEACSGFRGYEGHVGADLCRPAGTAVFAVMDGCVEDYSSSLTGYGGTGGQKGGAVLLRHKTKWGQIFYAVYGHNTPNVSYLDKRKCSGGTDSVKKGDGIATIHQYIGEADHLHFGIRPGEIDPDRKFRGNGCSTSDNCGWTDPFRFLDVNQPAPSIRLCAQISSTRQVCWDTKNWVDQRCESGSDWIIYDNETKWRYPATQNICSSTGCYRSSSILDFFLRPAYASLDGCVFQETGVGYGGSGPYPTPADPEEYGTPSSSDLPKLVFAGTSSSAPNLSATVVVEKSNKDEDPNGYLRVGDRYCGVKATNTTSVSIGSFQNKCILYDGKKAGNDPPVSLGSKTVNGLSGGSKTTTHYSFTIHDPGYYTLYGCVNTGTSPPKEKTISDNCGTKTFLAYSIPDVFVEEVYVQGGTTEVLPGTALTIVADFGNTGDDFHAGKNRRMTVTAELSSCISTRIMDTTDIDEDVLRHGDSSRTKTFSLTVPLAARGICTITVIADPSGELLQTPNREENRSNNRKAITFPVKEPEPTPPPEDTFVSCNAITQQNWISGGWVGLGYAPPFDENGTQILNASCKESNPNFLKITVGDPNNPQMISYLTGYIESKTTAGVFLPQALTCSGTANAGWCAGMATVEVSDPNINTTTALNPTKFYASTCKVVNAAWQCSGWRLGGAGRQ